MSKTDTQPRAGANPDTLAKAGQALEQNPLAALAGGIAIGAIAGALLPRSDKEKELLRPVGAKIAATAVAAVAAAKEAGRSELEARGLTPDSAREQVRGLFQNVAQAASTAGTAAVSTAKGEPAPRPAPDPNAPAAMADAGVAADTTGFNSGS
jgi:hypothetical protein